MYIDGGSSTAVIKFLNKQKALYIEEVTENLLIWNMGFFAPHN